MGKKKRARRKNNTTIAPAYAFECVNHNRPTDDDDRNVADAAAPTTMMGLSIGDTVKIDGLVNASKYNGTRGVIVSAVDVTTNRCGVRTTGKNNANVMAIQVTNLTLERRAKRSTIGDYANVDICAGAGDTIMEVQSDTTNIGEEYLVASQKERLALVDQNMSFLQTCEDAVASWARDNEWAKPILCNIIKKWREQATVGFVRFLNGNTTDCREANLQFVSLRDVILHLDEWKVNWSINFTDLEFDMTKKTYVRQFLQHPEKYLTNINDEVGDGTDATNDQGGYSSSPPILAHGREFASARMHRSTDVVYAHQSTDVVYADSHNTKHIAKIMKDVRKCKKDAVHIILSCLQSGKCDSFRQALINNGLISVILRFLSQCEHEDFKDVIGKVRGNLRTPADWIEILTCFGRFDQCKLDIVNGIQALVRCLTDDTKRLFFKSNKYWHEAVTPFVSLLSDMLIPSSVDISAKVSNILLQNEGFLESIVQKCFWNSHRSDLVKEYESYHQSYCIKTLEAFAHVVIRNIIFIGLGREMAPESFPKDGLDLVKTIAMIPVVSGAYDPGCNVYFVAGMIRMLKVVNSHYTVDRRDHFDTLQMCMLITDCADKDVLTDVIKLGNMFTANIDDACDILRVFHAMIVCYDSAAKGLAYPIDRRVAFAIKSGLLDMCFDFITHYFVCDMSFQVISCDPKRDELIRQLVRIAQLIQAVALHQNTSKAIRDRRCQIMEALQPLSIQVKTEQSTQFFDILSSVIELNEGSCSRCNKPVDWRTALFCEGCRRVAYCGVKCQKKDWRYGSHSSNCSFLARSADVLGLTTCDVRRSRNIVELTGLRNNIITSQKKLFLRHEVALFSQLFTYPDRSDYIVVFDLSTKQQPVSFVHYNVQCTCSTQRKWFEDFRSPEKVICLFMSDVLNGEIDVDGSANRIGLYAAFSIPNRIKSLPKEERLNWEKQAARNSSVPPHTRSYSFDDALEEFMSTHTRAEALKDIGNDYFKIGDYKSAVEMYKSATTINSSAPIYWSNLAASYEKLGMYDEMQKASEHCIDTDRTFIKGYFRLAVALKAKLQMSKSIVALDRGLDIDPTNADLKKMKKEVWKILHSTIGCRIFQSKEGRWHKDDSFQFGTKE